MNSFEMRVSSQDVNKKVEDDSIPDVDKLKDDTDSSETNTTDHELYTSTRKVTLSDITSEDFSTSSESHTEDNGIIDKNIKRKETDDTVSFSDTSIDDTNKMTNRKDSGLNGKEEFKREEYDTASFSDTSIDDTSKITNRKDSGLNGKEEFKREETYDTASFSDTSIDDTNKITNRKAIGLLNVDEFYRGADKQNYNTDSNLVCCISDMMKTLEDLSVKVDSLQQLKTDTQIIKEEIVEVMFEKDSALTEIKNNARNIIKRKDQQIQKLKNRSAENELDSVSIAAFKLEKSQHNLVLKDEIEGLKNKNRALSGMVAHIPILENKLKEAEEKHEVKIQFLKQHYEHKITDINNNFLINNDEFKALQDTLNQQLENKLHSIKSESNDKGQLDEKYNFMKVRIEGLENQVKQLRKVNDNVTKDKNYHLMKFGRELNDQKEHLKEELLLKENLGKLLKSSDEENLQLKEQLLKLCDDNTLKDKMINKQEGEIKELQEQLQRSQSE